MTGTEGKVPVFESAGRAVAFLREHWRFALLVAALASAVQAGAFLMLGANPLWLVVLILVGAATHAALLGRALHDPDQARARLPGDTWRVLAATSIIGFFIAVVSFMVVYVAMSVLIAPFVDEAKAAGEDQAALAAIMNRAIEAQPHVLLWATGVGGVLILLLTSRLYVATPASVSEQRIVVFDSWRWTKGNLLRIAAARVVVMGPALIVAGALQSLAAAALGAPGGDPLAMASLAQTNALGFTLFYAAAGFVQIALCSTLDAGLAAYLYRGLRPPLAA